MLLLALLATNHAVALQVTASGWSLEPAPAEYWGEAVGALDFPSVIDGHLMLASRERDFSYWNIEDGVAGTEGRGMLAYAGGAEHAWFFSTYGQTIETVVGPIGTWQLILLVRDCEQGCPHWNVEEHAVSIWPQGAADNWVIDGIRAEPVDPTQAVLTTLYTNTSSGDFWLRCGRVTLGDAGAMDFQDVYAREGVHCSKPTVGPDDANCAVLSEGAAFNDASNLGERFGCWSEEGSFDQLLDLEPEDRYHKFSADWSESLGDCGGFMVTDQGSLFTLIRDSCAQPNDSDPPSDSDDDEVVVPWDREDGGCGCMSGAPSTRTGSAWLLLCVVGAFWRSRREDYGT
jgi:hypothetical protein